MADFNPIFEATNLAEGGYQAFPQDRANYNSRNELVGTNKGISAVAWETYFGKPPTVNDMKAITKDLSRRIYKQNYWDNLNLDRVRSQKVAHAIFQEHIGSGGRGVQRVHKAINQALGRKALNESSTRLSTSEIDVVNSIGPRKLYETILGIAIPTRFAIVDSNTSLRKFSRGWMNRWKWLDATYTGDPLFSKRWDAIDAELKRRGFQPTSTGGRFSPGGKSTAISGGSFVLGTLTLLGFFLGLGI